MRARAVAALLVWVVTASAEEEEPLLFIPEVQQVEALSGEQGKAFALLGRVPLDVPGVFTLRAQRAVVWLHPETDTTILKLVRELREEDAGVPLWAVRAIYAEGGGVPAVFQTAGQIFRCSSFFYDFTTHAGVFLDADLRLKREGGELPDLVLRAKELRAAGPGDLRARDVTFLSSDYVDHPLEVKVERVRLRDPAVQEALGRLLRIGRRGYRGGKGPTEEEVRSVVAGLEAAWGDIERKRVTLLGLEGRAFGRTLVRLEDVEGEGSDLIPLRVEADVGSKGSLGTGGRLGVGLATKPVAWLLGAGYYDGRGPLVDLDLEVLALDGRLFGRTFANYIHDHGSDRGIVPPSRDRYYYRNRYRFEATSFWRIDGELTDISDAQWLRAFDEREFKEGKEQETLLYLRGRGKRGYVTLSGKAQTIGFLDTLEELPRLVGTLPVLTLLELGSTGALQVAGSVEFANLRFRAGDSSGDFRTARFDADPTLLLSFGVGPVRVIPFAEFRATAYENALGGDDEGRFAGTAGVRADVRLWRWFGPVRHVIDLSLVYEDLYELTEPASAFFPLDDTDRLTRFEALRLRWRNRLQRRTPEGIVTYVSFEISGAWFPDEQQPLGRMGVGFVETDLEWRIRRGLHVSARTEVDFETDELETASIEGWYEVSRDFTIAGGFRHLDEDSHIASITTETLVDTRWRIVTFSQYDFRDGDGLDQGLLVQRLGRTAVIGVRIGFDPGDEDFSFSVKIDLLEKFRKRQRRRRAVDEPRRAVGWP